MAHASTPMADALNTGASLHGQDVIVERPDGSRVTVCVHIDPVRDETGKIVGVTNFFYDVTERRAREIGIQTQADELEQAIQQRMASLSELSGRLLRAQDEERRRVSRDLHDGVGQSLAVLKMELSQAARSVGQVDANKLQDWMHLVDEAVREVRAVSFLLHPPMLDLSGLCSAIREYAGGFDKRSDMTIHVEIPECPFRLSSDQETALFRVVQECLVNAHRHSKARNVWIRVKPEDGAFQLEVEDDGQGIAHLNPGHAPEARISLGVGITGMRERMRELGGRLDIRSGSQGTRITASVPYEKSGTGNLEEPPKAHHA
jgi:signal transduction histidine kinase